MKNSFAVAAALAAGIGIGSFGVHALHAQAKPPVYMIEDNTVIDPAGFAKEFAPLARESLKTYGGRYLGGGSGVSIDGDAAEGTCRSRPMGIGRTNDEVATFAGIHCRPRRRRKVWPFSHLRGRWRIPVTTQRTIANRTSASHRFVGFNDEQPSARRIG